MKKLSKLKLHNATLLNDREMKNIVGGYGDGYDGYGSSEEKKCKYTCRGEEKEITCPGDCKTITGGVKCEYNNQEWGKIICFN